ncbi:hypothetical protein CAPTEDRAFT_118161 [Capitella teleta]|nr:hypothetical protein CAPTEDRAFT_118161 [Capitella teleta]|eukprot:ELT99762.1 hypothetical protein CAPTEDRAFT_118161 [Capitella teleta]
MSSEKGNAKRSRPQKYKNLHGFKNTLHDTSRRTKQINSIEVKDCCARCTEIIEWKIKYKKYKLLAAPRKCVRCEEKTVKQAYTVACNSCAEKLKICAKCNQEKDKVAQ